MEALKITLQPIKRLIYYACMLLVLGGCSYYSPPAVGVQVLSSPTPAFSLRGKLSEMSGQVLLSQAGENNFKTPTAGPVIALIRGNSGGKQGAPGF